MGGIDGPGGEGQWSCTAPHGTAQQRQSRATRFTAKASISYERRGEAAKGAEEQRISDEPHSIARERHGSERRRQALNGNGNVRQSVAMAWH